MNNTLESIWGRACSEPIGPWDDLWALAQAGVPVKHLMELGALDIGIKDGRWQERFRGERAIVIPICDPDYELIDLVAFRIDTPLAFWTHEGAAALLGDDSLSRAQHDNEILVVHETPLDWLRNRRRGVVILDWERYWPFHFAGIPGLKIEDEKFADRTQRRLERPFEIPPILVPV